MSYFPPFSVQRLGVGSIKLSGMLLKQVNSAAYGLKSKVNSISQAVVILGLKSLKNVLLASALREALGDQSEFDSDFWKQANATAVVSEALSQAVFGVSSEDAFLAGLFQDAGVLICEKKHARYNEVYRHSHSIISSILDFDRKILKTTHMAVSYLLAKQWELPDHICDAIFLLPKAYFWIKHQYTIDIKQQHPISPMSYCNR